MNITLSLASERLIQKKIKSGLYASPAEVIQESLRLLETYDAIQKKRLMQLNQDIDAGLIQLKQGKKILAKDAYARLINKIGPSKKSAA